MTDVVPKLVFHRDHNGFRLYGIIPVASESASRKRQVPFLQIGDLQCKWRQRDAEPPGQAIYGSPYIMCEPKSRIVTFRFVRPEVRDLWNGWIFPLGKGTVTLKATDSLTTDTPKAGLDKDARELIYHVSANKMADSLVNHAMDHRRSSQVMHPTARTGHVTVDALISNDLRPWFAALSGN